MSRVYRLFGFDFYKHACRFHASYIRIQTVSVPRPIRGCLRLITTAQRDRRNMERPLGMGSILASALKSTNSSSSDTNEQVIYSAFEMYFKYCILQCSPPHLPVPCEIQAKSQLLDKNSNGPSTLAKRTSTQNGWEHCHVTATLFLHGFDS